MGNAASDVKTTDDAESNEISRLHQDIISESRFILDDLERRGYLVGNALDTNTICMSINSLHADRLSSLFPIQTLNGVRYRMGLLAKENTNGLNESKRQICENIISFLAEKITILRDINTAVSECKQINGMKAAYQNILYAIEELKAATNITELNKVVRNSRQAIAQLKNTCSDNQAVVENYNPPPLPVNNYINALALVLYDYTSSSELEDEINIKEGEIVKVNEYNQQKAYITNNNDISGWVPTEYLFINFQKQPTEPALVIKDWLGKNPYGLKLNVGDMIDVFWQPYKNWVLGIGVNGSGWVPNDIIILYPEQPAEGKSIQTIVKNEYIPPESKYLLSVNAGEVLNKYQTVKNHALVIHNNNGKKGWVPLWVFNP